MCSTSGRDVVDDFHESRGAAASRTGGRGVDARNTVVNTSEEPALGDPGAYLAAIVRSSGDAIISKTLDGIITSWNGAAERVFGYTACEVIGRPMTVIIPPEHRGEEEAILARLRRGESVDHLETVRRRKDGRNIDVSLTISLVRDDQGRIIGAWKIVRDITERKLNEALLRELNESLERRVAERTRELAETNARLVAAAAERERSQTQLRQAQKMEAVVQLAAGMAHDFNNLLTAILCSLELLDTRIESESQRKLVQMAARAARRGARLNEQMLAFARKQHMAPRPTDLNGLIVGLDDMLRRTLGGTVETTTALASELWPALADPTQLELVILNLAINARDAMPDGGRVTITTRNVPSSAIGDDVDLAPGDYVSVAVADTGTGMSETVLARACEPFYTTKEIGKGSGLGLSQVYGVARQSGGGLRIQSALGKGTVVEVYLPRSIVRPAQSEARERRAAFLAGRRARVLVVDDQEDVREVVAAQLDALGYDVTLAARGETALDLIGQRDALDLLMVDYTMPRMSGVELARQARLKRPDLPVIIATGYADTPQVDGQIDGAIILKKPYRMSELANAVSDLLRPGEFPAAPANIIPLRAGEE